MEVTFKVDRHTPNTIKFAEDVEEGVTPQMGSLYLQKKVMQEEFGVDPKKVTGLRVSILEVTT